MLDFSLGDVGDIVKDLREAITGEVIKDPIKLKELNIKIQELDNMINKGQIDINKEESKHSSLFVAGWRPFIGWVGGLALAYSFIVHPLIEWYVAINHLTVVMPKLEFGVLINVVLAMLGFGGLRTFEKMKGVSRNKL